MTDPDLDMSALPPLGVEGPVRAEIFLVWLRGDQLELTGPDGATPWIVQLDDVEHPVATVERIVVGLVGEPLLVHSTSWRRDGSAVILSFLVAIRPDQAGQMATVPIGRSDLARSEVSRAPAAIATDQVLEHALRHLAWLAHDDPVVHDRLTEAWHAALAAYVPEPFRSFG